MYPLSSHNFPDGRLRYLRAYELACAGAWMYMSGHYVATEKWK